MGILKILDKELHLYIDNFKEVKEKFDVLISTSRLLGYKMEVSMSYVGEISFYFTSNSTMKYFFIDFYESKDKSVSRVNWIINDMNKISLTQRNWDSSKSEKELVGFLDDLLVYI